MTDILVKNVWKKEPFDWNGENIDRGGLARGRYIAALRRADGGDYSFLLEYVRRTKEIR